MPRLPRLDYVGARHHVMNRGARGEAIFRADEDCLAFLALVADSVALFALRLHAYALMGNHFHLLVTTPRGNLSEAMAFLQSRFARRQNLEHDWNGPLFRARYKNRLVEDERYWQHLLAYVHLNPVAAHLVGQPEDARWTSHRAYLGLERAPEWLDTREMLELFGGIKALSQYVREVQVGREPGPDGFDAERLWQPPASLPLEPELPFRPPRSVEQALAEVRAVTGLTQEEIERAPIGPSGNPARWLAMWWLQEGAGLGTNAIARHLRADPAFVSRALRRARQAREPAFERWKGALTGLKE